MQFAEKDSLKDYLEGRKKMPKGVIVRVVGGLFYVKNGANLVKTTASGKLRDYRKIPVAGDIVNYEVTNENEGYIKSIEPRKNQLVRPPVANIDQAIVVTSLVEPDFSSLLLDKLLVQILDSNIKPIIYFSKIDKVKDVNKYQKYFDYYKSIGIDVYVGNSLIKDNVCEINDLLQDKISIVTGQSGAGKSTLLNSFNENLCLKTGDFSASLGRGKHTTREVEFLEVCGGLVADTPGFSSMEIDIEPERLAYVFPGFDSALTCKFRGCLHESEPGCKIKELVGKGIILNESYENYLKILGAVKSRKMVYKK